MKITQNNFFNLLNGIKQFQIPIYQRNYAWGKEQCERLLSDIVKAGTPGSHSHYIGSVIIREETPLGGADIYSIIDGQQRTTSISLLLLALGEYFHRNSFQNISQATMLTLNNLSQSYLINSVLSGCSLYSKLYLKSGSDRNEYDNLLNGIVGTGQLSKNYTYFLNELNTNGYDPGVIFNGIRNAQLALVELNNNENPQLLFEAVNDTGKDLTEVDKIRNWIFMGLSGVDQSRLYLTYWQKIENLLSDKIEQFLRYYTEIKMSRIVGNRYYSDFKANFQWQTQTSNLVEDLLKDILTYSKIYDQYLNLTFSSAQINAQLKYIENTNKENFTPLILKIMRSYENDILNANDVLSMLKYVESYIVRRDMLNIPTNSLNPAMISMLNNCNSLVDLANTIINLPTRQRMPSDADLHTYLLTQDFYHLSSAYYYLERIEKHYNPAFSLTNPTIEHILPETIHTNGNPKRGVNNPNDYNWELDLGSSVNGVHDTYQHTLGNLTILPASENSRMSDYRFSFKRDWPSRGANGFNYGYRHTPIRISQSLGACQIWNEASIKQRCDEMVNYICYIWPHP